MEAARYLPFVGMETYIDSRGIKKFLEMEVKKIAKLAKKA